MATTNSATPAPWSSAATTCTRSAPRPLIRARLRLDRDQPAARGPGLAAHAAALGAAVALALLGWAPWLGAIAFAVLLARAAHGLSPWHRRVRPQAVGFMELGFGVLTALSLAIGYAARL
jgi:hypothetical protein